MTITVVRLGAPLLAWPAPSKFRGRQTELGPTFSAVTGLLSAAAGVGRDEERPQWIATARFACRIDRPGTLLRDFHTVNPRPEGPYRWLSDQDRKRAIATLGDANGTPRETPLVTERFYRQDQEVVVFFEDRDGAVRDSLTRPRWSLYAGRKSCPLSFPFLLGTAGSGLEEAVASFPSPAQGRMRVIYSFAAPSAVERVTRLDQPAGRVGSDYLPREAHIGWVTPPRCETWFDVLEETTR